MCVCYGSCWSVDGVSGSDMKVGGVDITDIPFLFQDYQQTINTAFLKAEVQKILPFSEHEGSELQNTNHESLDGLAFLPNKFIHNETFENSSTNPKLVISLP